MTTFVGKTLGKYRVVARLGRGGMAEVYKAYQPGLDRYVGIKVLHGHLTDDKDFVSRFEREALATGKLRHPNIVQAVDFDREGETYFLAMEFIDGPTLKDEMKARKIEGKPFTLSEVARIFTALCSAIDYAHRRGMVHRDIKPANVMINQEGQVVLTDFGIARIIDGTQFTQTGGLSGTPAYMSPEQGQGERGDERSDIYALGVMLYEMVTGMVPYEGDTPFAVIMKHISEPLPIPTAVNPSLPERVERVVLKAMSKSPNDRYQSAGELAQALREAVGLAPDDNLQKHPLTPVALPPQAPEIDHSTERLTAQHQFTAKKGDGATVLASSSPPTTVTRPASSVPVVPLFAGGAGIVIVLLGVIGYLVFSNMGANSIPTPDPGATQVVLSAGQTATAEAESAQVAAQANTATAEFAGPTQTAEAEITQAAGLIATETAEFERLGELFVQAQASTAEAATATALVTAQALELEATQAALESETSTAQALKNTTAPTEEPTLTPAATPTSVATLPPADTATPTVPPQPTETPTPEATPTSPPPAISGKLAFPVDSGTGKYDVYVVSIADGERLGLIQGARQPNFRLDGQKLLINGEGGGFGENVFETSPFGAVERPVSGSPSDLFPFYKPDGTTLTYSNPQLAYGSKGYQSYLFVQCGLKPPNQESDKCSAIADFGIIIPPGAIGDIIGSHPVWMTNDLLAYKGCNTWEGGGSCGIFSVGSWAVKRTSEGERPRKLADGASLTPTDAKAGLVAYMSRETGDWEVFVMGQDGAGAVNLSSGPGSQDGLGTISPDGKWVAFASNREGAWAIYVAPTSGGSVEKLFNFPTANPWGTGDRDWSNERMSWAP